MSTDSLDLICNELDDLAIRMLCLMKEYINVKVNIEELIKSGTLHLAKSRYIMGNRSVSILQLPTEDSAEFHASTRVVSSKESRPEELCFELSRITLQDLSDSGAKVRSRNPKAGDISSDANDSEISIQDPLKWFGVLLPQNMRQAQGIFGKVIDYSIQCVNIQLEMGQLENKYKSKIKEKEELKSKQ